MEEFYKPKVFYADITQKLEFALCEEVIFCNNTTYFLSSGKMETLSYITKFLNHKLYDWYYRTISVQLGESAVRMFSIYVLNLPVPHGDFNDIYEAFGLSKEEIEFIERLNE